ncbi:MAG: MaoC/PaaZ C-terminal domain-containing protein [Pseudomonadota bacterium]
MATSIPPRLVLQQGGVIGAFVAGATKSLLPRRGAALDRSEIVRHAGAPSVELQQAYAAWSRAAAGRYDGTIPIPMIPSQIALPVISALTARSPYPLLGVLNQGIHLRLHRPLPATAALQVRGHLVEAGDDGYRARIHSMLTVGTAADPRAVELDAYAAVVLKRRADGGASPREEAAWTTVGVWQAAADEGRKFFYLTGDFNPIHTWAWFAKRTPFRSCIMHGYGAFTQIFETIRNAGHHVFDIDSKFVRPLPLPSPPLQVQVTTQPAADGRLGFRLVDTDGVLYQVGTFLPRGAGNA